MSSPIGVQVEGLLRRRLSPDLIAACEEGDLARAGSALASAVNAACEDLGRLRRHARRAVRAALHASLQASVDASAAAHLAASVADLATASTASDEISGHGRGGGGSGGGVVAALRAKRAAVKQLETLRSPPPAQASV
jgi:hypothetical protein